MQDVAAQSGVGLDTLSKECSQTVLSGLAKFCVDWQLIGKYLNLTDAEITAVDGDKRTVEEKRAGMLANWKEKFAYKATYQTLIEVLLAIGKSTSAIDAAKLIGAGQCKATAEACDLMIVYTVDSGPSPSMMIKTEPHTQTREYNKRVEGK